VLKYLIDIRCTRNEPTCFVLEFEFTENPYFSNKILTKTYYLETGEFDGDESQVLLDHAEGYAEHAACCPSSPGDWRFSNAAARRSSGSRART
jgi:hypothetical protein